MPFISSSEAAIATSGNTTGRRTAARLRIQFPGKLIMLGGTYNCALEDISQTGARALCEKDIGIGETGVLQCMEIDVLFEVVRANKGLFGLQFQEDVSADAIRNMRSDNTVYRHNHIAEVRLVAKQWATGKYV
jgi:hypothetical protein